MRTEKENGIGAEKQQIKGDTVIKLITDLVRMLEVEGDEEIGRGRMEAWR